jgi:catechol 2,3-dioxygenase-like lactoylglutathione lyase family enzyme
MTPLSYQVTVDCADPHAQARFWADALGYDVEDHEDGIRELLDAGIATDADVIEVAGRLGWRTAAAIRHPHDPAPGTPEARRARRLLFQLVAEPKTTKNRWHLDLNVGRDRIDDEVDRLRQLGATELYRVDEPGAFHTTMADPEGNEFCVQ